MLPSLATLLLLRSRRATLLREQCTDGGMPTSPLSFAAIRAAFAECASQFGSQSLVLVLVLVGVMKVESPIVPVAGFGTNAVSAGPP